MVQKKTQSEETQTRILQAAQELFARKGYVASSIEEIAAAADTSKANIYYHFKSKEGLFFSILEADEQEWRRRWEELRALYPTVRQRLHGMVDFSIEKSFRHPLHSAACEFMDAEWGKSELVTNRIAAKIEDNRRFYEQIALEGIATGEFKPENATRLGFIMEGLFRSTGDSVRHTEPDEAAKLLHLAVSVLLNGIAQERED